MGAWDVGMLSNDSALDAIYVFRDRIRDMPFDGKGVLQLLKDVAMRFKRSGDVTLCVLAVTESLQNQGVKIPSAAKIFLAPWVGKALLEVREQGWDSPEARIMALGRFSLRLMGERISTEPDNHSLLEGIRHIMKSKR